MQGIAEHRRFPDTGIPQAIHCICNAIVGGWHGGKFVRSSDRWIVGSSNTRLTPPNPLSRDERGDRKGREGVCWSDRRLVAGLHSAPTRHTP
jgi:hypothetical protein